MKGSLRAKILATYGVGLLLTTALLAGALVALHQVGEASQQILRENYRSLVAVHEMRTALDALGRGPLSATDTTHARSQFTDALARAASNLTIPGEGEVVADIAAAYDVFRQAPTAAAYTNVTEALERLRHLNETTMYAASHHTDALAKRYVRTLGLVGVAALLLGALLSVALAHRLAQPLRELGHATRRLADGDYTHRVAVHTTDEIGILAAEFNVMAAQLSAYRQREQAARQSERATADTVLRTIEDGVVVVDLNRCVVSFNPAALTALPELDFGRDVATLLPSSQVRTSLAQAFHALASTPAQAAPFFHAAPWTGRQYEVVISPVRASSEPLALVLLRDVTRLRALDQLRSNFVRTASHELRTPLTSIAMSIGLLLQRALEHLGPSEQDLLRTAQDEVHRLMMLVNDLLDLERLQAGSMPIRHQTVQVAHLVAQVATAFRLPADAAGISLTTSIAPASPDLWADPDQLAVILTNLLSNALRHTPEGGSVSVAVRHDADGVAVDVQDTGVGIPVDEQEVVFEPFVQGQHAPQGGSGLGLAISRSLAEAHGGSLRLRSGEGLGTTFTLWLPTQDVQ